MKKIIHSVNFADVQQLLAELSEFDGDHGVMYVKDFAGVAFNRFQIVEEKLSDGSIVRDLVLGVAE